MGFWILDGHEPRMVATVEEWARWFESADRHVAVTFIGDYRVSTVFLGIDHAFGFGDWPVLFETMVFRGDQAEDPQERYATWDEAEAGHRAIVAELEARA